jgi:hypothetical protein
MSKSMEKSTTSILPSYPLRVVNLQLSADLEKELMREICRVTMTEAMLNSGIRPKWMHDGDPDPDNRTDEQRWKDHLEDIKQHGLHHL